MADTRVTEAQLDGIDYAEFTELVLVAPGADEGRTIYRGALVLAAGRGQPARGLHPSEEARLLVEIDGDPRDGDVARDVKRSLGLSGPPGNPFGWMV